MPLPYVSVSYLFKVNSGRKVVHWTRTLSQDSCSHMDQCTPPTFPPYFCLAPIFFIGFSTLIRLRICVFTQLKWLKKQLKFTRSGNKKQLKSLIAIEKNPVRTGFITSW